MNVGLSCCGKKWRHFAKRHMAPQPYGFTIHSDLVFCGELRSIQDSCLIISRAFVLAEIRMDVFVSVDECDDRFRRRLVS